MINPHPIEEVRSISTQQNHRHEFWPFELHHQDRVNPVGLIRPHYAYNIKEVTQIPKEQTTQSQLVTLMCDRIPK